MHVLQVYCLIEQKFNGTVFREVREIGETGFVGFSLYSSYIS